MQSLAKISKHDIHWGWCLPLIRKSIFWIFRVRVWIILGWLRFDLSRPTLFLLCEKLWKKKGESILVFSCALSVSFSSCGFVMGDRFKLRMSLVMVSLVKTRSFMCISPLGVRAPHELASAIIFIKIPDSHHRTFPGRAGAWVNMSNRFLISND